MSVAEARENKKKEIYTYKVPWTAYCLAWCRRQDDKFKMAVGSYKEEYSNKIQIIQRDNSSSSSNSGSTDSDDNTQGKFVQLSEYEHPYPATKIMWAPAKNNTGSLFTTTTTTTNTTADTTTTITTTTTTTTTNTTTTTTTITAITTDTTITTTTITTSITTTNTTTTMITNYIKRS